MGKEPNTGGSLTCVSQPSAEQHSSTLPLDIDTWMENGIDNHDFGEQLSQFGTVL